MSAKSSRVVCARAGVTIKQLGGESGPIGLHVFDQASFSSGEEVLLFLEMRPRDRTLYTAALAQGKWSMRRRADGARVARRDADSETLVAIRGAVADARSTTPARDVSVDPVDAASSQPFTLMTTPYLYTFFPAIDMQAGGQEGLAGGGLNEIQTAAAQWSSAGSTFRYTIGSANGRSRCASQFLSSYRVTIAFLDPCGEISNNGGTLAIGGSYFSTTASTTVNGRSFRLALEGFVINNDSSVALQFLRQSGCFHNIQLHELGHVLGLGHSTDPTAIMFPSISNACSSGPSGLAPDDIQGIRTIYPLNGSTVSPVSGVPGQSTITRATAAGETLTVEWLQGLGAAPTTHRLDFIVDSTGQLVSVPVGSALRVDIPVPSGTRGTFSVRVTPFNDAVPGPASAPFAFAIGLDVSCAGPPAPPNVSGIVSGGTAVVGWPAVPGATSYLLQGGHIARRIRPRAADRSRSHDRRERLGSAARLQRLGACLRRERLRPQRPHRFFPAVDFHNGVGSVSCFCAPDTAKVRRFCDPLSREWSDDRIVGSESPEPFTCRRTCRT